MRIETRRVARLAALLLYCTVVSVGYLHITLGSGSLPWPFSQAEDTRAALLRVAAYLPVLGAAVAALWFVRASGRRIADLYARGAFDRRTALVLTASGTFAGYMLAQHPAPLAAPAVAGVLLALCVLNAFAEETLYRGVFPAVLATTTGSVFVQRVLPALAYAAPHLAISASMAALGLAFGLALGWVREGRGGLWACVACHFVVDLGAIGLPFLPPAAPS